MSNISHTVFLRTDTDGTHTVTSPSLCRMSRLGASEAIFLISLCNHTLNFLKEQMENFFLQAALQTCGQASGCFLSECLDAALWLKTKAADFAVSHGQVQPMVTTKHRVVLNKAPSAAGRCITSNYLPIGAWPRGLFTLMQNHVRLLPFSLCLSLGPVSVLWFALSLIFAHRSSRTSWPCMSTP